MKKFLCYLRTILDLIRKGKLEWHDYEGTYEPKEVIAIYNGYNVRESDSYAHGLNELAFDAIRIDMTCKRCGHKVIAYMTKKGRHINEHIL